ncbi:GNAT family N-acetyltransferase [Streptosporangium amethystogenes]|uniref:GNAT family N-acetyltransferase n=1 Tax=Streptosporangium amethystogenes TaxID=2002 RepID=UPI00360E060B
MPRPCDRLDGPRTQAIAAEVIDLYRHCYAAPPWSETPEQLAGYPAKLAASTVRPGFTALTARDLTGRLTGICYGWPTPADLSGNPVYDAVVRAFGPYTATALTRGALEVAELFVHPGTQGRGIGRTLLTRATAAWSTAWLITDPHSPAADLYRHLGWRESGPLPRDLYPQLQLSLFTLTTSVQDPAAARAFSKAM